MKKDYTIVEAMQKAEQVQALQKKFEEVFPPAPGSSQPNPGHDRICIAAALIDAYREGQASMLGRVLSNKEKTLVEEIKKIIENE